MSTLLSALHPDEPHAQRHVTFAEPPVSAAIDAYAQPQPQPTQPPTQPPQPREPHERAREAFAGASPVAPGRWDLSRLPVEVRVAIVCAAVVALLDAAPVRRLLQDAVRGWSRAAWAEPLARVLVAATAAYVIALLLRAWSRPG
jgi:hypothetical protein